MSTTGSSRRERTRQATLEEIRATARELLITQGAQAVTINAVARKMGFSGPAVYRYYESLDALIGAVTADFFHELSGVLETTRDAHAGDSPSRRLLAMCRAMRAWAIGHRMEFGWLFASPIQAVNQQPDSARQRAGESFEQIFAEQVQEQWRIRPFAVPDLDDLDASLREQLLIHSERTGRLLPPEALHVFLTAWIRLYGLLCMEVMNQLDFAFTDLEPVFEECLKEVCGMVGLDYRPPE